MKLWKFELKKLWRRKQFLILTLITILAVLFIFLRNYWSQDEIVTRHFESLSSHSTSVSQIKNTYKDEMILRSENDRLDDAFITAHDNAYLMEDRFKVWLNVINNKNWHHMPEAELAFIQTVRNHISYGEIYPGYSNEQLEEAMERNQLLIELGLPYEDELYSITTPNFMKIVFSYLLSLPTLGLFVLLLGDIMVKEKEQQTIRTLTTQPITRWQILVGKFTGNLTAVFFTILIIILSCFIIPFIFGGQIGSFSYPQLIHVKDGFEFIPIFQYLLTYILLFIGVASFLFSLVLLFSTFLKDRLSVLFFTLLTLFGGVALTNQITELQSTINPFYYLQFQQLIEQPDMLRHPLLIGIPYVIAIFIVFISALLMKANHQKSHGEKEIVPFKKGIVSKAKNLFPVMFNFEWRKILRQGQVKHFTIVIVLIIMASSILISFFVNQLHKEYITRLESNISFYNEMLLSDKEKIKNSEEILSELDNKGSPLTEYEEEIKEQIEADIKGTQEFIPVMQEDLKRATQELTAWQQGDWKTTYEAWKEELTLWWTSPVRDDNSHTKRPGGGQSDFTYLASIQEKEWMIENEIEPVLINYFIPYTWTIHDEFISPVEQLKWNQETRKLDNTGLFLVYTFFTTPSYFVLLAILLFLFGAGLSAEKGEKRTLLLLRTQPITKSTVFLSKTWISMVLAIGITIISLLSIVLIGTILNRFGDWKFPVLHYDAPSLVETANYTGFSTFEGGFHFMFMGTFLMETIALFLTAIIFLIALCLMLSMFFKHTNNTIVIALIIAFGGYVSCTSTDLSTIAHWLPFTYLNVGKIANGELATILGNYSISTGTGTISLLIGTLIFMMVGILLSKIKN